MRRLAFIAQYYTKKLLFQIKSRAPLLKKLHIDSFPAIHFRPMDWMDFMLKFSGELLILILSLAVAGLNIFFFAGNSAKGFQDKSLAQNFLQRHPENNPRLYAKNSSIVTVLSSNSFLPLAQAEDFGGFSSQSLISADAGPADGSTIVLGDDNSILAPSPDSIKSMVASVVKKVYVTQPGDTLKSLANKNGISVDSIKLSNPKLVGDALKPGWNLIIPPVDGVAITADSNTTLPDLAVTYNPERYNKDKKVAVATAAELLDVIISYNGLDSAEDINSGDTIFIPGGKLATPPAPKPAPKLKPKAKAAPSNGASDVVTSIGDGYDGVNHLFPKGYCTYYVAGKMTITFGGNAKNWLANARASGYVVKGPSEPAVRTAVVTTDSRRYGHVAYVEEVTDTAILVSEMNYVKFNKVNQRWIPRDSKTIRGYIYP